MIKDQLTSKMLVRITAGKGTYNDDKWKAIIEVISVNHSNDKVSGIQYRILAQRGEKHHPDYLQFQKDHKIQQVFADFDDWWETFDAKILV